VRQLDSQMSYLRNRLNGLPVAIGALVVFLLLPQPFRDQWGNALFITLVWLAYAVWDGRNKYFRKSHTSAFAWTGLVLSVTACLFAAESVKGRFVPGRHHTLTPLGFYVGTAVFWVMQLIVWILGRVLQNASLRRNRGHVQAHDQSSC
jgi:hypothetical protein